MNNDYHLKYKVIYANTWLDKNSEKKNFMFFVNQKLGFISRHTENPTI